MQLIQPKLFMLKTEFHFLKTQFTWRFKALLGQRACLLCEALLQRQSRKAPLCLFCQQQWQSFAKPKVLGAGHFAYMPWQKPFRAVFYSAKFKQAPCALKRLSHLLVLALQQQLALLKQQGIGKENLLLSWIPHRDGHKNALYCAAVHAAWLLGIKTQPKLLQWQRVTLPQHKLKSRQQRKQNMQHAFKATIENDSKKNPPRCILILDDLWTSGNTLQQAQQAVTQALNKDSKTQVLTLALAYMPLGQKKQTNAIQITEASRVITLPSRTFTPQTEKQLSYQD